MKIIRAKNMGISSKTYTYHSLLSSVLWMAESAPAENSIMRKMIRNWKEKVGQVSHDIEIRAYILANWSNID